MYDSDIPVKTSKAASGWVAKEVSIQKKLYQKIVKNMDDLAPTRAKWYQDFLTRIQVYGFNADGDQKIKIKPQDIPVVPKRKDKVVW